MMRALFLPRERSRSLPNDEATVHLIDADDDGLFDALIGGGFNVIRHAFTGAASISLDGESPDIIILNLPGNDHDGPACCRNLRHAYTEAALCVVHDGLAEWEETVALELGADVVIPRPAETRRVVAQIRALQRRQRTGHAPELARFRLQTRTRTVDVDGRTVRLTDAEFELLRILAQHPGCVVSRDFIYEQLRGLDYDGRDRAIDLRISRIRRKLGDDAHRPVFIRSVRGEGYMLMVGEV